MGAMTLPMARIPLQQRERGGGAEHIE